MERTFKTHISLSNDTKQGLAKTLNIALATTLDLQSQVKQAHWNIKGPQFFARHELFDKLAARLRVAADNFAERASTLGAYAGGTLRLAAENSRLEEYDLNAVDGARHIQALVKRYQSYSAMLRDGIDEAEKKDPATADLLTEVLRQAELDMWFLESHLQL